MVMCVCVCVCVCLHDAGDEGSRATPIVRAVPYSPCVFVIAFVFTLHASVAFVCVCVCVCACVCVCVEKSTRVWCDGVGCVFELVVDVVCY